MKTPQTLPRLLYDWMGALFVCCLFALAFSGDWGLHAAVSAQPVQTYTDGGTAITIVVDAGHGGVDGGATSASNVPEAGLNLAVAKLVESGLREAGFSVIMTRVDEAALAPSKQQDMRARREIMRDEQVDAVVSIHMNKFRDISISGPRTFYMLGSLEGEKLAGAVLEAVCTTTGISNRPANPGDYYVLRESVAPAVIVECGFLSNPEDATKLQEEPHQQAIAQGIVAGVAQYFANRENVSPVVPQQTAP